MGNYKRAKIRAIETSKNPPLEKQCKKCKEIKSLAEFDNYASGLYGKHPRCQVCKRSDEKTYYSNNEIARQKRKDYNKKRKYGLSPEDIENILKSQNYCCAICSIHLDKTNTHRTPHIDHCHSSGKIRGILCSQCNVGLGHFYDNQDALLKAVQYLRKD